jgi:hypothetical protein
MINPSRYQSCVYMYFSVSRCDACQLTIPSRKPTYLLSVALLFLPFLASLQETIAVPSHTSPRTSPEQPSKSPKLAHDAYKPIPGAACSLEAFYPFLIGDLVLVPGQVPTYFFNDVVMQNYACMDGKYGLMSVSSTRPARPCFVTLPIFSSLFKAARAHDLDSPCFLLSLSPPPSPTAPAKTSPASSPSSPTRPSRPNPSN